MADGKKARPALVSRMGWNTPDKIVVQGQNFCRDILGKMTLTDLAWLEITGQMPTPQQSDVLNALLVTLVEHGLTPMAVVTRMTYMSAPESLQGAIGAGLQGVGSRFAGTIEGAAKLLQDAAKAPDRDRPVEEVAKRIVDEHLKAKRAIPGLGHPVHKPIDPRTPVLFEVAARNGFSGRHVALMQAVAKAAAEASGKVLPINATGAIGAIATELGLDWRLGRGLAVVGRCIGLLGHIAEELKNPIGMEIWMRAEEEVSEGQKREAGEI